MSEKSALATSRVCSVLMASEVPRVPWRDSYHKMPFWPIFGLVVAIAFAFLPSFIGYHMIADGVKVKSWGLPVLLVIGVVFTIVPLLFVRLLWEEVRAALRDSNWSVRITNDAIYVNLRSLLNWRFSSFDQTVLRIPWAAITGVHEEHEVWRVLPKVSPRIRYKRYVALVFASDVDIVALDNAVRAEIRRVLEHPAFPAGSGAWQDMPAFIDEDGQLRFYRVEMSLLRALARRLPRGKMRSREYTVGQEFDFQPKDVTPTQIAALVMRSEWSLAQMTVQFRMGMSYQESVEFIRRLFITTK